MSSCESCGTHTGTHWPNCPHYMGPRPQTLDTPLSRRTNGEKNSYVQGFEAALKMVEEYDLDFAKVVISTTKETI